MDIHVHLRGMKSLGYVSKQLTQLWRFFVHNLVIYTDIKLNGKCVEFDSYMKNISWGTSTRMQQKDTLANMDIQSVSIFGVALPWVIEMNYHLVYNISILLVYFLYSQSSVLLIQEKVLQSILYGLFSVSVWFSCFMIEHWSEVTNTIILTNYQASHN